MGKSIRSTSRPKGRDLLRIGTEPRPSSQSKRREMAPANVSTLSEETKGYLDTLKERARTSRVYRKYQLIGLLISQLLEDEKHKTLYIKLAKENDAEKLLALAKDIAERKNVQNKGAYFMRVWQIRFKRYTAIPTKRKTIL